MVLTKMIDKPEVNEYANFYQGYVEKVGDMDALQLLEDQLDEFTAFVRSLSAEQLAYRYAPGKWTLAELIGHMLDAERVFSYRVLRFSRNDKTPIPGFDQEPYVRQAHFNDRDAFSFAREFEGLRISNIELIKYLTPEQLERTGEASGYICSVRALVYILAGHLKHHWDIIQERYVRQ